MIIAISYSKCSILVQKLNFFCYRENPCWNSENITYELECKMFAQMLWRTTERFGCATSVQNNLYNLLCYYQPGGNKETMYADNVPIIRMYHQPYREISTTEHPDESI